MSAMAARKSSSIGSISGEWNACDTLSCLDLRVVELLSCSTIPRTSCSTPAMTTAFGPLTAAIDTPGVSNGVISSSEASTAIIAPPVGSACISEARAEINVHASSRLKTPATCAAAISPIECPASRSALIPNDSTSRYSATSSAKIAGCAFPVWSSASASSPHMIDRSDGSRCASTASNASANTGNRSYRSRPMPSRCEPCPVNNSARSRSATSPLAISAPSTTTTRCSNELRDTASE